ncbi:MAG: hypothetical protein UMS36scaffold28_38 [Phage 59_13]|nr:MAG: hypothetical protein UMS36scaffold28_38 [Phage 59_13]
MLNQTKPEMPQPPTGRQFGEYLNTPGHRCPCYEDKAVGPPQYEAGDNYFCFARFKNPFFKEQVKRYAAISVFQPNMDAIQRHERYHGRAMMASEWPSILGAHRFDRKPISPTAKGLNYLFPKVEAWLEANMIDECDHRLIKATTAEEWKKENAELCRLYGVHEWARMGGHGKDWMKLHSATNFLEMLRQADNNYFVMAPRYEEPKEEKVEANDGKKKQSSAETLAQLNAVDTTATDQQQLL